MEAAFPRWMAMLILCLKNSVARFSPVRSVIRRPINEISSLADGRHGPIVSKPTGLKMKRSVMFWYLMVFSRSASVAACPTTCDEPRMLELAIVSTQVTSQARGLPCFQGLRVFPSGLVLLLRSRPGGSSMAGIEAETKARLTRSLSAVWRLYLPMFLTQLSPWCPDAWTTARHRHWCSRHMSAPRRSATAIRRQSSSNKVPNPGTGSACSHEPDSLAESAMSLTLSRSVASDLSRSRALSTAGRSHCCWRSMRSSSSGNFSSWCLWVMGWEKWWLGVEISLTDYGY